MGFILDTNLLIGALRDEAKAEDLERFYEESLPFTFLHAIVAEELLAGAIGPRNARTIEQSYIAPFERRNRLVVPTYGTWKRTGQIIAQMIERKLTSTSFKRSFVNDVMLAASCRESGHTLITSNTSDFERIRKVEQFKFVAPYPET